MEPPKPKDPISEKKYFGKLLDSSYLTDHNLELISEIGRGGFGVVYKCRDLKKTKKFALKILFSTAFPEMISSELAFLRILKNSSKSVKMIKAFHHEHQLHILMEYGKNDRFIVRNERISILVF